MDFQKLSIRMILVGMVAAIVAACHPKKAEEDAALFAIASSQITGLALGNCAISINHAGLTYGTAVQLAINLSSGLALIGQEGFNTANFESAAGKTLAELGYSSLSAVPYNIKYDAFFNETNLWTNQKRVNTINFGLNAMKGFAPVALNGGLDSTSLAQFSALPANIQQAANAALGSVCVGVATAINSNLTPIQIANLCGHSACGNLQNFWDAVASNSGNCFTQAHTNTFQSDLAVTNTFLTNIINQISDSLAPAGLISVVEGTAALACARIPRANCSVRALTTANQAEDIQSAVRVVNTLINNPTCQIPNQQVGKGILELGLKGLTPGTTVNLVTGPYTPSKNPGDYIFPYSTTSVDSFTKILPERAYPKFGSLVGLGFGALMPINRTNQKYELTTNNFRFGKNLEAKLVASCESLGLDVGITPTLTNLSLRKGLTPTPEIAYALSPGGQAASLYATVTAFLSPPTSNEVNCNNSFRSQFAIPQALGGGTLPPVNAGSGDGGATSLLSICVYGGTAAKRAAAQALLGNGLSIPPAEVAVCGSGALEGFRAAQLQAAELFGDVGTVPQGQDFPNTQPQQ